MLNDLITQFLAYGAEVLAYSPHTIKGYRSALSRFADSQPDLLAATAPELIAYDQVTARTLRPRSRARNICALRAFYKWATEEAELLKRNPSLKLRPPTLDCSSRSCPGAAIRARLLDACDRLKDERKCILSRAIFGAMLHGGLRANDVCTLQLGDVILTESDSYLIVQKGKRNKRREVPLSTDLVEWLREWLRVRQGRAAEFFVRGPAGRPITQYYLRSLLAEVKAIAGVRDRNLTPHSLRHSCATSLYEAGVDLPVIQEVLGHASVDQTRRYVHPTDRRKFDAVQKLNGRDGAGEVKKVIKPIRLLRRLKK